MRSLILLGLTYVGFVSLGLPDGMFGVAWPGMRRELNLPLDAVGWILVSFTTGYSISSFGSGAALARVGLGTLVGGSALITAISLLAYAWTSQWSVIVAMAWVAGMGAGAVDSGLNAHAALHHGPGTLNWLHAAYGAGAAISPLLLGQMLSRGLSWHDGYLVVGGVELILAIGFLMTRKWWMTSGSPERSGLSSGNPPPSTLLQSLKIGRVWAGVVVFFIYTGIEAGVGIWGYTWLTSQHGLAPGAASAWVSAYWAALAVGRIVAGFLSLKFTARSLLRWAAVTLLAACLVLIADLGTTLALFAFVVLGLGCAPMFPLLIALTPDSTGHSHAANAVGVQIAAAMLGQSLLPSLIGVIAARQGIETIPLAWLSVTVILIIVLEASAAAVRTGPGRNDGRKTV